MKSSYYIQFYRSARGEYPVRTFLMELSLKDRTKMARTIKLLKEFGLSSPMPHCRSIVGYSGLFELRSQMGNNAQRIFYFYASQNTAILLHGFTKKSQKTPSREIETAVKRKSEWLNQNGVIEV